MQNNNSLLENTIIKKLENAHAIWFGQSKSFLLLEEPAFSVFDMFSKNKKLDEIILVCSKNYGHLEENISQFVHEVIQQIQYFNNPKNSTSTNADFPKPEIKSKSIFPLSATYQISATPISFHFQNEYLKFAIHPVFAHLEKSKPVKTEHEIELLEHNGFVCYTYNGKQSGVFKNEDFNYFTGSIKQQIYSIIYNRDFNNWMMMLHASGIIIQKQAIVFSAAGGSGKSTISAILKARGGEYISDDFIAADKNGNVYPFPAAISVKDGAVKTLSKFYPELKNKNSEKAITGKKVRYLPVHNKKEINNAPYPVKAMVFVHYNSSEPFTFEKVSKKVALQLLLKETWVNPVPEMVTHFFDWIEKTSFYKLKYSQTSEAIEAVNSIYS